MNSYRKIHRPNPSEYPSYSQPYFDLIKTDDNILQELHGNFLSLKKFIHTLNSEKLEYRYAENKWTIKEILVHNIDDERIFTYRALSAARNDRTPLPGFEEKDYTVFAQANERSLDSIFDEYQQVRLSTIKLFQYLPEEALMRIGGLSDTKGEMTNARTVRALAYHIAGHELHHVKIVKERYLGMSFDTYPL